MTNSSLQEISAPVVTTPASKGAVKPKVANPKALELLNLEPIKTVWGWQGRTILERMPAESQGYQIGYDEDQAYVYIEPQYGVTYGAGSIQVGFDEATRQTLSIQDGIITWKEGQAGVPLFRVDISRLNEGLGLQTGEYQVGYTLRVDYPENPSPIPGYSLVSVEDESLASSAVIIAASGGSAQHLSSYAIESTAAAQTWWPGNTTDVDDYFPGGWFVFDFQEVSVLNSLRVLAGDEEEATASCALYFSDDAILWKKTDEVRPVNNQWKFNALGDNRHRYWRLFFWGGNASVRDIRFTGQTYYPDSRTVGPVTIAEPYIDDLYEEVEGDHILLAHFTVAGGVISEVRDQRRFINRKYEPVSEWLTTFPDEQIRCLFDDVQNYSNKFLSPVTGDYHFYEEMDDSLCTGLGQLTLGTEEDVGKIIFPDVVEIVSQETVFVEATLDVAQDQPLSTDPSTSSEEILAEGLVSSYKGIGVRATGINLVLPPTTDGGLATKVSTDETFQLPWSVDDGIY